MARVVTWKKTVRRRLAVGGAGLTIGAAILFVAAVTPAFAHTPVLSGSTVCSNRSHVITWSIGNDYNLPMAITSAAATKGTASYAVTGYHATVGPSGSATHATSAKTVVPASATGSVTLTIHARWTDGFTKTGSTSVSLLGPCMGSTTTTSSPVTTPTTGPPTTLETTTSTVGSQGSTLPPPSTTSTVASLGSTVAPPTTAQPGANSAENGGTPIAPLGGPSGPPSGTSITQQLPFTGSGYAGPILGAGSLVLGGIAVAIGSARKRRRETV